MENIPIADHEAAVAEARAGATIAERSRIGAILQSDAAKDRPAAALKLAMTADVGLELANSILATIAAEQPVAAAVAPRIYGQRSQDAPGGLVIEGAPQAMSSDPQMPKTEHQFGREVGKTIRERMKNVPAV